MRHGYVSTRISKPEFRKGFGCNPPAVRFRRPEARRYKVEEALKAPGNHRPQNRQQLYSETAVYKPPFQIKDH